MLNENFSTETCSINNNNEEGYLAYIFNVLKDPSKYKDTLRDSGNFLPHEVRNLSYDVLNFLILDISKRLNIHIEEKNVFTDYRLDDFQRLEFAFYSYTNHMDTFFKFITNSVLEGEEVKIAKEEFMKEVNKNVEVYRIQQIALMENIENLSTDKQKIIYDKIKTFDQIIENKIKVLNSRMNKI